MPLAYLSMSLNRLFGAPAATLFGVALATHRMLDGSVLGFYTHPLELPVDFDVSRPSKIYVPMAPVAQIATAVFHVTLVVNCSRVAPLQVGTTLTVIWPWPTPAPWPVWDFRQALVDNGDGHTFPGGSFNRDDTVGFRVYRSGSSASDDYTGGVYFADCLLWEYSRLCQFSQ